MQTEGDISEDAAFADVLADLMQDRLSSSEAVGRFAEVCEDNAARLRCDPTAPTRLLPAIFREIFAERSCMGTSRLHP